MPGHACMVRCLPCDDDEAQEPRSCASGREKSMQQCMTTHTHDGTNVMHAHRGDTMDPYLAKLASCLAGSYIYLAQRS
jgi:hypothetical protein